MTKTRITVDMIDADGCTFNKQYRQRLLSFIKQHRLILAEFAQKPELTEGEKALITVFITKALEDQKKLLFKRDEFAPLLEESISAAKDFFKKQQLKNDCEDAAIAAELEKFSNNYFLNNYLYHHIQYMEALCPSVLRAIFILSNSHLINRMESHANKADIIITMLGSNRQSYVYDQVNMKDKGTASIYPELPHLVKYINSLFMSNKNTLDRFTLADAYEAGEFKPGRNYKKILKCTDDYVKNAFDNRKINIIYAACHYVAQKYPAAQIAINLIDDQSPILDALKTFYLKNSELLPKNVELNLCKYDGRFTTSHTVAGTGVIDYNFHKNVRLMATLCGYDPEKNDVEIKMTDMLDVKKFMQERVTGWECIKYNDNSQITLFKKTRKRHSARRAETPSLAPQSLL